MEVVGTDLFEHEGRFYLVAVDAFTGYPYVRRFARVPTSHQVTHRNTSISEHFASK